MRYFKISLDEILKIQLLGKETLFPPREHITRYTKEYILYAVTAGELKLRLDDKTETLTPGDIYLFEKGIFQAPVEPTYCEYYYAHFLLDGIEAVDLTDEEYQKITDEKRNKFINAKLYSMECYEDFCVYVAERNHIDDKITFEHYINILKSNVLTYKSKSTEMLLDISNSLQHLFIKLEQALKPQKSKTFFRAENIARYIEEHFRESISAEIIEKEFFINFDYANRIFESVMMCSIIRYRNLMRLNYAKLQLSTTTIDINKIARDAGFESMPYFSRLFKKYEGVSPSEYRKKYLWG